MKPNEDKSLKTSPDIPGHVLLSMMFETRSILNHSRPMAFKEKKIVIRASYKAMSAIVSHLWVMRGSGADMHATYHPSMGLVPTHLFGHPIHEDPTLPDYQYQFRIEEVLYHETH